MALNPPNAPTLPDIGDPSTFNPRALAQFGFAAQLRNWLAGVSSADFFDVLGPVMFTNGKPSGALMEEGTSANGFWKRWANGYQICGHTLSAPTGQTALGSIFASDADLVWTFPAAFAARPVVAGSRSFAGPEWLIGGAANNEQPFSQFRCRIASPFSMGVRSIILFAAGDFPR